MPETGLHPKHASAWKILSSVYGAMLKFDWLSYAAFRRHFEGWLAAVAFILALAVVMAVREPIHRVETAKPQQATEEKAVSNRTISSWPVVYQERQQSEEEKDYCTPGINCEQRDLVQQRRMAEATKELVKLTNRQLYLNTYGLAALIISILISSASLLVAARSVRVAANSVTVAQQAQRPWISICEPELKRLEIVPIPSTDGRAYRVQMELLITLENTGPSPALNAAIRTVISKHADAFREDGEATIKIAVDFCQHGVGASIPPKGKVRVEWFDSIVVTFAHDEHRDRIFAGFVTTVAYRSSVSKDVHLTSQGFSAVEKISSHVWTPAGLGLRASQKIAESSDVKLIGMGFSIMT